MCHYVYVFTCLENLIGKNNLICWCGECVTNEHLRVNVQNTYLVGGRAKEGGG